MPYISEPTQFFVGWVPDSTASPIYTVPAGKKAILSFMTFTNSNTTTETLNVYIVPSGETVGLQWKVITQNIVATFTEALDPNGRLVLEAGDEFYLETDTASKLSGIVVGAELTAQ